MGGGTAASGRGRGEMRGAKETTGGGREETVGGGHPRGGAGAEGAGVVARRVTGGIPAVPMEGGEAEGGRYGRLGAMPRLLVEEDGVHSGVSVFFFLLLFLFLLTIFLGKEGGSAGPAPLPNGGV